MKKIKTRETSTLENVPFVVVQSVPASLTWKKPWTDERGECSRGNVVEEEELSRGNVVKEG